MEKCLQSSDFCYFLPPLSEHLHRWSYSKISWSILGKCKDKYLTCSESFSPVSKIQLWPKTLKRTAQKEISLSLLINKRIASHTLLALELMNFIFIERNSVLTSKSKPLSNWSKTISTTFTWPGYCCRLLQSKGAGTLLFVH